MKFKYIVFTFLGSVGLLYVGMFFGDLGGVGGYDGIAPRWLYEKVNLQPGNDVLSKLAAKGSIVSLCLGVLSFIASVGCMIAFVVKRVGRQGNS